MIGAVQNKSDFEETLQKARTMLVFMIENQPYALSIEHVAQIIPMLRLTAMPQVDQMIEGVANIHGNVVPVISVRRYLGMPYRDPGLYTPIILTRIGERLIGLIVDEVRDVLTVPGQQVVAPKDILPETIGNLPVMSGVVYQHDQSILLLEPRHLLRPTQIRTLNRAMVDLRDSMTQVDEEDTGPSVFETVRAALAEKRVQPVPEQVEIANPTVKKKPAKPAPVTTPNTPAAPTEAKATGKPRKKKKPTTPSEPKEGDVTE